MRRARCCPSRSTARRRCSGTTRTLSRRRGSIPTARRRPGRKSSPRWRSSRPRGTPVRSRPVGRRGRSSKASRPGTTCPFLPRTTASPGRTRSSCSTARCRRAISKTCRTGSRRVTSSTAGARKSPKAKFYSGECAMMTTSSAAYGTIKQNAKFKFAESTLPYYADVAGAPQNTIIGGASLWVMGGKKKDDYKGVAQVLTLLSQPDVQAEFSQATGYLPITMAAYELTKKSGFYDKNPGTNVAVEQMIVKTTANSRGVRAGNFPQIRDVMDEELEAVWAGKKTAKQGLDDAAKRGNEIIDRFNKANKG